MIEISVPGSNRSFMSIALDILFCIPTLFIGTLATLILTFLENSCSSYDKTMIKH
jgi:ABC-type phosphate transport system permease subunit